MANLFKKSYSVKLPKYQHEVEEFGKGKKGLAVCKNCSSVYFKKSWHHGLERIKLTGKEKDLPLNFILCPACQMIENKQYEGRLIIKNVSEKLADQLGDLVAGFCRRVYERDPMDRLIAIKKTGSAWEVTVTENELANKLANKIKNAFNKIKVSRRFSKEPSDVIEVTIEFL